MGTVDVVYQTLPADSDSPYYPSRVSRANGSDYSPVHNATITFQHGQTSQMLSLTLKEDDVPEPDEYLLVQLAYAILQSGGQERPRTLSLFLALLWDQLFSLSKH